MFATGPEHKLKCAALYKLTQQWSIHEFHFQEYVRQGSSSCTVANLAASSLFMPMKTMTTYVGVRPLKQHKYSFRRDLGNCKLGTGAYGVHFADVESQWSQTGRSRLFKAMPRINMRLDRTRRLHLQTSEHAGSSLCICIRKKRVLSLSMESSRELTVSCPQPPIWLDQVDQHL